MANDQSQRPQDAASAHELASAHRREIDATLSAAVALHQQGHLSQAATLYAAILKIDPHHADALHLSGLLTHRAGDFSRALELIDRAIASNPRVAHYHFNRGVSLQALNRLDAAVSAYSQALELYPAYAPAHENRGVALQDSGDLDGARAAYEQALRLEPESILARRNLGTLLSALGRNAEAREHFDRVLKRAPADAETHWKRSLTLLAEGRFAEGWAEYEWRTHAESFVKNNVPRVVPFPKWDGTPLDGALLITAEQGIGDEIMFASCYGDAMRRAGRCIIECDPRLVELFARSFPDATFLPADKSRDFSWSSDLPPVSHRVGAGSLPGLFRLDSDDFPSTDRYLQPNAERVAVWRAALRALPPGLNVGISWRGGRDARARDTRSIALREWQPLFAVPGVNFVDLQYGDHRAEVAELHAAGLGRLRSLPGVDPVSRVDDFVALLGALDLVVSIDNSTVFMAGAIGAPTWALLPFAAEWRWLKGRERCIWHPSVELFRQQGPGVAAWQALLAEVAERVRERAAAAPGPMRAAPVADARVRARVLARRELANGSGLHTLLVNDTSNWYHWGCTCTSLALHQGLRRTSASVESLPIRRIHSLAELPETLDEFDDDGRFGRFSAAHPDIVAALRRAGAVDINGEGSLHGLRKPALGILYLAYVAKRRFGLRVRIVNHSCYPDGEATGDGPAQRLYRKVYEQLDFVGARERRSCELLKSLGIAATQTFDCLPLYVDSRGSPAGKDGRLGERGGTVVIAGSVAWRGLEITTALAELVDRLRSGGYRAVMLVGASAYLAADDVEFTAELRRLCGGSLPLFYASSETQWLEAIGRAALLVSGRFHHSLAAAFLGTPFLALESNTPKITGMLEMLGSAAFVSSLTPGLGAVLKERAVAAIRDPRSVLPTSSVRRELLALASKNFAPA